ncbi:MAG TPA: phosphoribosyltransferase family protein [Nocardioides sp.]|nr:phosphoribosyltransferase family protein [Nocardioides sp.]
MFEDRAEAGRRLATLLRGNRGADLVVLGLPRGGVPVAAEVARALDAPLDVIVVRKLGVPSHPELAMGAVGEGGVEVVDGDIVRRAHVDPEQLAEVESRERAVVAARVAELRRGRPPLDLIGRVAVIVDDGIATGSTAAAACGVARSLGASRVVVAAPVAPPGLTAVGLDADELVCLERPWDFQAVGTYYRDFTPTTDREVAELLTAARA